jgi:hypothetical protein
MRPGGARLRDKLKRLGGKLAAFKVEHIPRPSPSCPRRFSRSASDGSATALARGY